ncbi:MAG: ribosomal-protein-alanine N-acetyltransferase [Glaciecola sp.]
MVGCSRFVEGRGVVIVSRFAEADVSIAYNIFKKDRISPWSFTTFENTALNGISLVAKQECDIIGYVLLTSVLDEFTIEDITVSNDYRGQGLGRRIMEAGFELANKMQQKTVYLEVRCSNQTAIKLYRSMGFELVGERKNYYETTNNVFSADNGSLASPYSKISAPRENAYVMKKVL